MLLWHSLPRAPLALLKVVGRELQTAMETRSNRDPTHLRSLKSWSGTLIYQALFKKIYMHYPTLFSHQLWNKTIVPIFQMETFCLIRVGSLDTCPLEILLFSQDLNMGMRGSRSHAPSAATWNRRQYDLGQRMERAGSNSAPATYTLGDLRHIIWQLCSPVCKTG